MTPETKRDLINLTAALGVATTEDFDEIELLRELDEVVLDRLNQWWRGVTPQIDPTEKPCTIGTLMTWDEWCAAVDHGAFVDYDGYGHAADAEGRTWENIVLKPSMVADHLHVMPLRSTITHVMWYNR